MRRAAPLLAFVLVLGTGVPAGAGDVGSFTACGSATRGGECTSSLSVLYGSTVYLEGTVDPPHADLQAVVWHQDTEGDWERWGAVNISARGKMRYAWQTTLDDGDQVTPHHVQFRIPGHGKSNKVEVMVFFGE
jgi:hypothetical protein